MCGYGMVVQQEIKLNGLVKYRHSPQFDMGCYRESRQPLAVLLLTVANPSDPLLQTFDLTLTAMLTA